MWEIFSNNSSVKPPGVLPITFFHYHFHAQARTSQLHEIELGFPTATVVPSIEMHRFSAAALHVCSNNTATFSWFSLQSWTSFALYPMQGGGELLVFSKWE